MAARQQERDINPQMEKFCQAYIKDQNMDGPAAATAAGYKQPTVKASKLLADKRVKKRIAELMTQRNYRTKINADYVLNRLVEIDQMDVLDILTEEGGLKPISLWPKVWRTSLSALDINRIRMAGKDGEDDIESTLQKVKWPDKVKNLELIGRHVDVNAFKDRVELDVSDSLADKLAAARLRAAGKGRD